jgi:DMSO/TMAO reductase YedYZ molybdopterin-dependent catalytic subunit
MQKKLEIRDSLPVHASKERDVATHRLRVDGLVDRPLELRAVDLETLPQQELADDFTCLEGWTVPSVRWRGVTLEAVLRLARAHPEARWVQASAENFSAPVPLKDAGRVLLATHIGADALPVEHGGPIRLVAPGGDCFTSIKWLDHLELRAEAGENTAQTIALGRLRPSKTE